MILHTCGNALGHDSKLKIEEPYNEGRSAKFYQTLGVYQVLHVSHLQAWGKSVLGPNTASKTFSEYQLKLEDYISDPAAVDAKKRFYLSIIGNDKNLQ